MKDLTVIILGNQKIETNEEFEILTTTEENLISTIEKASRKYIVFVKEEDSISDNYLESIKEKLALDFDACYINYDYLIDYKTKSKQLKNKKELEKRKPYYKEYIWSYIFKKEKLLKVLTIKNKEEFNKIVEEEFQKMEAIEDIIYYHQPKSTRVLKDSAYSDVKEIKYSKNIIYVGGGCNGTFNGYITWINNLGRCYHDKYEITILYDKMPEKTKKIFEQYFTCWENNADTLYVCDRLLAVYTYYYYSKNIICDGKSYLFIHGNMSDYPNAMVYKDDIYTNYIAVSETSAKKAAGHYPTDNIEFVLNPIKMEPEKIKPHLRLISTFRYSNVKKPERVEKMAKLMTEMQIPYTWEVFTDKKENTNVDGLIFRKRVNDPLPYVKDCDYLVLLSDSEACSYSILEAISLNVKVIVTPLPLYSELGLVDNNIATIIPFEYFEEGNETKLKEMILKIYKEKEIKENYKIDESLWDKYNQIFT